MCRTLVGILTGPLTLSRLSLAPRTKSPQTVNHKRNQNLSLIDGCQVFQTFQDEKKQLMKIKLEKLEKAPNGSYLK
jgi:hypothetical protein